MKPHESSSAAGSATTSPTRPPPLAELPSDPSLSAGQYLHEQSANAAAAFKQTLGELGSALQQGVGHTLNPARLTREHPLIALPAALVAGFAAASAMVPSKQQQAEARLARLVAALKPTSENSAGTDTSDKPGASGGLLKTLAGTLGSELFHLLTPTLKEVLLGSLAGASVMAADEAASTPAAPPQNSVDDSPPADPADVADISSPS